MAFQVPGRIAERLVDAGEDVAAGALLLRLDETDFELRRQTAEAGLLAAEAQARNAAAERARLARLAADNNLAQLDFDRVETRMEASREAVRAAKAALELAESNLAYTRLTAPAAGRLIEVSGQVGQVVQFGQPVAFLAAAGPREIEVALPQSLAAAPPRAGWVLLDPTLGRTAPLELREIAGAADPLSRTWRALPPARGGPAPAWRRGACGTDRRRAG